MSAADFDHELLGLIAERQWAAWNETTMPAFWDAVGFRDWAAARLFGAECGGFLLSKTDPGASLTVSRSNSRLESRGLIVCERPMRGRVYARLSADGFALLLAERGSDA
jgi:hypothetical protein